MTTTTTPSNSSVSAPTSAPRKARSRGLLASYLELTKAKLSALVLLTTAVGFVLASEGHSGFDGMAFLWTLLGTALAAGCANAFNQVLEASRDAWMHRTRGRPLPSGAMSRGHAIVLATVLGTAGITVLALAVNELAALLAAVTILLYVLVYTPMKAISSLNTLCGAICGAIPPVIGWAGAAGTIGPGAWALGGLLFIWQIPHFLALAWLYREDYARGRFAMLPIFDREGQITCQIVVLTSLMLVPVALSATLLGLAGWVYTLGAVALGAWMLVRGVRLYLDRTNANARRVFLASLVYLSAVLVLLVLDRGPLGIPAALEQYATAPVLSSLTGR